MNKEWSLDDLYSGFEDDRYQSDKDKLKALIEDMNHFANKLSEGPGEEEEALLKAVEYMESYQVLGNRLSYYVQLRHSVNTSDGRTMNEMNAIEKLHSQTSRSLATIHKFIAGIENIEQYMEKHAKLKGYRFILSEIQKEARYLLSEDVEEVISKLNISAGSAWGNMQNFMTSTLEVDYRGDKITLPEVRNLAYHPDADVRKDAYEAELKAYDRIKDTVSYSLNNIKTQVNTICELRGYTSPLDMTLIQSRMKRKTLDAMLKAMKEYMPVFRIYLKQKGKILGHASGLPWYDLFAPVGESNRTFTVEEARDYLLRHFRKFSDDLANLVQEAFEKAWIDFYPRRGKVGGAFCENLPFLKQSRLLTNFTGSFSGVVTMAHELGHAYHGHNIEEHLPLNTEYSMPVAETASTFNEAIIMEAAIEEAEGREKMALIESQLMDATQIICDIYSRFLFESAVFEKSQTGFLFADELKEIMLSAQREAYGDGLDPQYLHPYMWVCKSHYYSENISFYNFPYAFGGLFARGLYKKYKTEGKEFLPKYKALLNATTVMSVEDAAKVAGIDLENPEFWRTSLRSYEELVKEFINLSE